MNEPVIGVSRIGREHAQIAPLCWRAGQMSAMGCCPDGVWRVRWQPAESSNQWLELIARPWRSVKLQSTHVSGRAKAKVSRFWCFCDTFAGSVARSDMSCQHYYAATSSYENRGASARFERSSELSWLEPENTGSRFAAKSTIPKSTIMKDVAV